MTKKIYKQRKAAGQKDKATRSRRKTKTPLRTNYQQEKKLDRRQGR